MDLQVAGGHDRSATHTGVEAAKATNFENVDELGRFRDGKNLRQRTSFEEEIVRRTTASPTSSVREAAAKITGSLRDSAVKRCGAIAAMDVDGSVVLSSATNRTEDEAIVGLVSEMATAMADDRSA